MENVLGQLEELRLKKRKLVFVLGELLYALHKTQNIRFLYTSSGVPQEKEVQKLMRLIDYISGRIKKFEGMSVYQDVEVPAEKKSD